MAKKQSLTTTRMSHKSLLVGLTGSLASGKTSALKAFESMGWQVLSADQLVHEIYAEEGMKVEKLRRDCLKSAEALTKLEKFVHPRVRSRIRAYIDNQSGSRRKTIVEIPLLFEGPTYKYFDINLYVHVPKSERLKRAKARGMSGKLFQFLDSRQLPPAEKAKKADFILQNTSTPRSFIKQLNQMSELLAEFHKAKNKKVR